MHKNIQGKCACSQPTVSAYMPQLTEKPSAPLERALNSGLDALVTLYAYSCICTWFLPLNTYLGIHTDQYAYDAHAIKQ